VSEHESTKRHPELDAAHPHDALFKFTFSRREHLAEELRCILPANVSALLDFTAIEAVSGTFADRELRGLQSDLLLKVRLAGAPFQHAFVHLIFEHQSSHDPWLPLRLLRYKLRVLERARLEAPNEKHVPPVLAVVLYHGDRARTWD
jgi:predicted transposase/invertase (TIGR01784 family)